MSILVWENIDMSNLIIDTREESNVQEAKM